MVGGTASDQVERSDSRSVAVFQHSGLRQLPNDRLTILVTVDQFYGQTLGGLAWLYQRHPVLRGDAGITRPSLGGQ